ncbi:hypothetical protein HBH56_086180 [Parastagonospora nodorum]|uniref:Heterokaryon incompatibility domain-containing protein n=2 Tax=Phaeosphaeria nodorum (strain SN15 / ATCC MYA-4574 / FGSC 10173) TaxID=321614 RepID=A0A7U2F1F4_PHANO|nr:hypothetical protein SNOG_01828 [Parastagonospora nodorum SN15]KAH3915239.1 hypothetical protein HBH56_086180 [Parastagonospora nodorum]EAT91477.1 hypothetical protein SNOG_01828 [Parastagonospora nodorum SN15]KAH3921179.1 hypothetical protein HBH54_244550 [Parastagonospora nodorum]KAH4123110.1 hypothetical protein HBH45_245360 [Parastagonospora nodorum]KAH4146364.1 hypothetical protein HBH44_242720 [Parastagonospora nodorum]
MSFPSDVPLKLPRYKYKPLERNKKQMRLIELSPMLEEGTIHCTLEAFDFAELPGYIALSYTSGPPTPVHGVEIDECHITVRENLYHFLQQYRKEDEPEVYLWIDQISIDQSNIDERSSQVQFMRDIYQKSDSVITWLGDGSSTESTRMRYEAAKQFNETKGIKSLANICNMSISTDYGSFKRFYSEKISEYLYTTCGPHGAR